MRLSVSLCEASKCSCFSSFTTTFPANTFFTQLTCWCPNEEACEWASSQWKNNPWITLPSVHSHSSLLPLSLFYWYLYFPVGVCQSCVFRERLRLLEGDERRQQLLAVWKQWIKGGIISHENKAVNRGTMVGPPIILWQILCSAQENQQSCVPPERLCLDWRRFLSWSSAAHAV